MKRGSSANRLLDRYVGIPVLWAMARTSGCKVPPQRPDRITIMASPTLGDTLITSAPLQDLRMHYPDAHMTYFASKTNAAAAELLPCVDEIVPIDLTSPIETLRTIRACKADVMIDFTQWQRITAFYTANSGAKYRVGFQTPGQHRHWHYDLTAEHSRDVHELDNFRSVLVALGLSPSARPALKLPKVEGPGPESSADRVILHPWATGDRAALREWPLDNWVALACSIAATDTLFIVTGAPSQLRRSEALCRQLRAAGLSAEPHTSRNGLASLTALITAASLVVAVNTGIMHLAAILGAPTVALNGPTSGRRWGPIGERAISVKPRAGGGFLHLGFEFAGNPKDSMGRIQIDDVLRAISSLTPELLPPQTSITKRLHAKPTLRST